MGNTAVANAGRKLSSRMSGNELIYTINNVPIAVRMDRMMMSSFLL